MGVLENIKQLINRVFCRHLYISMDGKSFKTRQCMKCGKVRITNLEERKF